MTNGNIREHIFCPGAPNRDVGVVLLVHCKSECAYPSHERCFSRVPSPHTCCPSGGSWTTNGNIREHIFSSCTELHHAKLRHALCVNKKRRNLFRHFVVAPLSLKNRDNEAVINMIPSSSHRELASRTCDAASRSSKTNDHRVRHDQHAL